MVTLEVAGKAVEVAEVAQAPLLHQVKVEHWYYQVPCAGVKYFSYGYMPAPAQREKDRAIVTAQGGGYQHTEG